VRGQVTQYVGVDDDELVERRGASGAHIIIGEKYTTKLDVERTGTFVRDQGAWLSRWATESKVTILPRVTEVFSTGYRMETLQVPHLRDVDVLETCELIHDNLLDNLWHKIPTWHFRVSLFETAHPAYVHKLVRNVQSERKPAAELETTLRGFYDQIDWNDLTTGLTHGDPIVDNVGYRAIEGSTTGARNLVLLDPIPATVALPNWRAVDVGRIIQSMVGYEHVRYQRTRVGDLLDYDAAVTATLNWYMPRNFSVNEARACLYFSVIHMLRAVRTTGQGTAARLGVWYLTTKLIEETKQWMR
jgi:hypothetical protein